MLTATVETADIIRTKVGRINEALSEEKDGVPGIHLSSGAAFGALVDDYDALFDAADTALYRVKSQGGCGCEVIC
jgi:PleD family two-component response regulator